jgi:hypothetical protein
MVLHPLNLLPLNDRKRVGNERLRRFLALFYSGVAMIFVVGIVLLLPTYFFLFFQNKGVAELAAAARNSTESEQGQKTEQLIEHTNNTLRRLKQEHSLMPSSITRHLNDVISLTPAGIILIQYSYTQETDTIQIRGTAAFRDNLLYFVENLQTHSEFENIESPVENILREKDIDFTISFHITNTHKENQ